MTVLGIDLGTSNSLVSFWDGKETVVIPNELGKRLTPSVVGLDSDDRMIVGEIAKERLISHPDLTVATFKRFMGTEKTYNIGTQTYSPIELSAFVLKALMKNAEDYLDEKVSEAIISVPAYFNNQQREATKEAAILAGINVRQLISEPTAAAVAYGLHLEEDQTTLVIDLGGGTYDVSLLDMFEGIIQVEAIAGDNHLGGEDFTRILIFDFLEKNQLSEESLTLIEESVLYGKMESLKRRLSSQEKAEVTVHIGEKDYFYELTSHQYEKMCQNILERMRKPIARVLNDRQLSVSDIDCVILVGGATRSPMIRNYFAKYLRCLPYTLLEPDETIAIGAGIQGSAKDGKILQEEMMLTDVCGFSLGVEITRSDLPQLVDGIFSPIIERNTTIPVSKEKTYFSIADNQDRICFKIYQGESMLVKDNLKIGELEIKIPPAPRGYPVTCRFTYDNNGILEVIVRDHQTQKDQRMVIENGSQKLSKDEIEASLKKLEKLKIHPKDRVENKLLIARLERLYEESIGDQRLIVQDILMSFLVTLEQQDEYVTKKEARKIKSFLDDKEREHLR